MERHPLATAIATPQSVPRWSPNSRGRTRQPARRQTARLVRIRAGSGADYLLPAEVVPPGSRRGPRPLGAAWAAGDGVRRSGWASAGDRPIYVDPVPAWLCHLRTVGGAGAR